MTRDTSEPPALTLGPRERAYRERRKELLRAQATLLAHKAETARESDMLARFHELYRELGSWDDAAIELRKERGLDAKKGH